MRNCQYISVQYVFILDESLQLLWRGVIAVANFHTLTYSVLLTYLGQQLINDVSILTIKDTYIIHY